MVKVAAYSGDADDSTESRVILMTPLAAAIAEASSSLEEQAALLAQSYRESGWARYVLENRCEDGPVGAQCDAGKSRGPFQVKAWCKAAWDAESSLQEQYVGGARCALRLYRAGKARCRGEPAGGFSMQLSTFGRGSEFCSRLWAVARSRLASRYALILGK
jgi:hypothetical protein